MWLYKLLLAADPDPGIAALPSMTRGIIVEDLILTLTVVHTITKTKCRRDTTKQGPNADAKPRTGVFALAQSTFHLRQRPTALGSHVRLFLTRCSSWSFLCAVLFYEAHVVCDARYFIFACVCWQLAICGAFKADVANDDTSRNERLTNKTNTFLGGIDDATWPTQNVVAPSLRSPLLLFDEGICYFLFLFPHWDSRQWSRMEANGDNGDTSTRTRVLSTTCDHNVTESQVSSKSAPAEANLFLSLTSIVEFIFINSFCIQNRILLIFGFNSTT